MRHLVSVTVLGLCLAATATQAETGVCVPSTKGTQLTLEAQPTDTVLEITPDTLNTTQRVLEARVRELGVDLFSVEIAAPAQLTVQLANQVDMDLAIQVLSSVGDLSFQQQKHGTDTELLQLRHIQDDLSTSQESDLLEANHEAIAQLFDPTDLTGAQVVDAIAYPSQYGRWAVTVEFDPTGTGQFADITRQLAGTGRRLGIFVDGRLLSDPTINVAYQDSGITGGSAVISGNFTQTTAQELAIQLRSQALPTALELTAVEAVDLIPDCRR
ncbi:MAG: hypothetical protein AAGI69_24890 [Cyanobacteria bacterium P01_H01_bin.21]